MEETYKPVIWILASSRHKKRKEKGHACLLDLCMVLILECLDLWSHRLYVTVGLPSNKLISCYKS